MWTQRRLSLAAQVLHLWVLRASADGGGQSVCLSLFCEHRNGFPDPTFLLPKGLLGQKGGPERGFIFSVYFI